MLRGLSTVSFFADDLAAAKAWYSELLGVDPYFVRPEADPPAYVEFRIGDYQHELGIIDSRYAPHSTSPAGAVIYWHVDDLKETYARLLALGAKENEAPVGRLCHRVSGRPVLQHPRHHVQPASPGHPAQGRGHGLIRTRLKHFPQLWKAT
jgi:predicted enzyme related to lactoylglutathione lyase